MEGGQQKQGQISNSGSTKFICITGIILNIIFNLLGMSDVLFPQSLGPETQAKERKRDEFRNENTHIASYIRYKSKVGLVCLLFFKNYFQFLLGTFEGKLWGKTMYNIGKIDLQYNQRKIESHTERDM